MSTCLRMSPLPFPSEVSAVSAVSPHGFGDTVSGVSAVSAPFRGGDTETTPTGDRP